MKLKDEDGGIVQEISCKSVIGHAVVHSKRGIFIVDNATDGFTLYRLEGDGEPVQMFATAVPSMSVPKQVAFGEEGKVVVGGSDNGLVYVFDRKTGQIIETLHHADTDAGLMRDLHGRCTIASTSTALGRGKTTIKIWAYKYTVQKVSKAPSENHWSLLRILMMLTQLLALLSMSIFLLVNYKDSLLRSKPSAMMFDEYVDIEKESPTEGYIKNDIRMLRELAAKLIELAQEVGGEINEDEHRDENKGNTDHPRAATGDEQRKDLVLIQ
ncbi:hypothetical protein F4604DRAFT_1927478 [Suillus subluteus]|nr:hypothetical protein F4604DRAFT_1927478 [Suillus subluteus]